MQVLIHPDSTQPSGTSGHTLQPGTATGSTHLRTTESVINAATLRGTRATGTSAGTQSGPSHEEGHESRRVEAGHDWLDNNGVNLLMAICMSLGAMGIAPWVWGV